MRRISQKPERPSGRGRRPTDPPTTFETRGTYDERLNHILAAATDLMARVGYEQTTMRAVAKAAGVSLAGLYHYFDSKEKMLFLIQFRTFNALVNGLKEKLHGVADPIAQLNVMVRAHVGYFAANMAALKVCSHELDSLTGDSFEGTRRLRREYYAIVRTIVDQIFDAHAPASLFDPYVATMSLFGMLNWLYRWYNPRRDRSPNVVASQISAQFLHGMLENTGDANRRDTAPSG